MSLIGSKVKAVRQGYQLIGGSLIPIDDVTENYIKQGYNVNDTIYSIINLILDKIRLAPWGVYQVEDESSLKAYHSIQRKGTIDGDDLRRLKGLQRKAMTPVKSPGKWKELLKYPNENDTFQELVANGAGYKMLTGNKFYLGDILEGGADQGIPNTIRIMPSQFMQLIIQTGFPPKVLRYCMPSYGAKKYEIEQVLHEKYFNYEYTVNGNELIGMAPLKAALYLTNRSNSALKASTAKFQNGGVEVIVYVDEPNLSGEDREAQVKATKQGLIHEYTGPDNWGKIVASGYKMGAINLGLSPVELNIIEAEKWDMRRFCNVLGGVPSQLLNDPENKTYNNQKEGEKALTARCALSHLSATRDSLNRKGHEHWGLKKNWILDYDMTVFSELEENMSEKMVWIEKLANMTGLPINEVLSLAGIETLKVPEFDEPRITPQMGQFINDWRMNDVDQALNTEDDGDI